MRYGILAKSQRTSPTKHLLISKEGKKTNLMFENPDRHTLNQVTISNRANQNCHLTGSNVRKRGLPIKI